MNEDRLERQIAAGLSVRQGAAGEEHPGAEILAAFSERRLDVATRESVAGHLAGCEVCREVLWLSAPGVENTAGRKAGGGRRLAVCAAAAAGLALVFAGSISRTDDGVMAHGFAMHWALAATSVAKEQVNASSLSVAYASEELGFGAERYRWRVRKTGAGGVLEASGDAGKTWKPAKIEQRFEPEAVGFRGSDVWVKGRSGETLLSRDLGRHWVHRPAVQSERAR